MKRVFVLVSLVALAATGCSKDKKAKEGVPPGAQPPSAAAGQIPSGGMPAAPPASEGSGSGKVLETMNSGGYTYVKVDVGGKEMWAAGPETAVAVGEVVSFSGGAPMANYHSKTLDRTFDMVYFVPAINKGGAPAGGGAMAHGGAMGGGDPHAGAPAPEKVEVGKVEKAAGGQTVAEVFSGKDGLAGKEVTVRGKVVKYNSGIMGRNWLHLQDGSGAAGANDLTVTTNDTAAVGDTVTIKGKVATNKDFGAGYKYDVIVEDAKVSK